MSIEKLQKSVMVDCVKGNNCFNPEGCDNKKPYNAINNPKTCFHNYCDKYKWVIDRAKHYGEKLNVDPELILNSWEKDRDYWYMNYYQESNQPEITSDKVRVFDTVDDFVKSVDGKGFRCPACNGISTNPYRCNSGDFVNKELCHWKVYGLFGALGKGVFVFCKDKLKGETIFMPIAWEEKDVGTNQVP